MKRIPKLLTLLLVGGSLSFTACTDTESDHGKNTGTEGKNPLGEQFIAPNGFDWKTMTTLDMSITVNDRYNNIPYYSTIEIYDKNPFNSPGALLLLKGYAKDNQPLSTQLSIPKALDEIFIRQITPEGRSVVYSEQTNKGKISIDLTRETSKLKAARAKRATGFNGDDLTIFPVSIPTDAVAISGDLIAGNNYIIDGTTTEIPAGDNVNLYVIENAVLDKVASAVNRKIFVMPGKTLTINTTLAVEKGNLLSIGANATLKAGNITSTDTSEIYNNGKVDVSETTTLSSQDSKWINNGPWITKDMVATNSNDNKNNILYHTLIVSNKLTLNNARIEMRNLSYALVKDLDMTSSLVFVLEQSYFYVTGLARFEDHYREDLNKYNEGKGFNGKYQSAKHLYSLVRINKAILMNEEKPYNAMAYAMGIEVVCDDHFKQEIDGGKIKSWTLWEGCRWTTEAESTVIIPGEEEGGKSPGYGGDYGKDPVNPEIGQPVVDTRTYSFLFEDQWPSYGDYDMNDVVIYMNNIFRTITADNKVNKLSFDYTLMAVGGTKSVAAALMLDGVTAGKIQSVAYDTKEPQSFNVTAARIEANQTNAVIPLFDNAHKHIGAEGNNFINTYQFNTETMIKNPPVVTIEITFNIPIDITDLDIATFNLFIITDTDLVGAAENKRKEIHLLGYAPTDRANTDMFGTYDDNSSIGQPYISRDNLTWGIIVPDAFQWPVEYKNIKIAYPLFEEWIISAGELNADWYKTPAGNSEIFWLN